MKKNILENANTSDSNHRENCYRCWQEKSLCLCSHVQIESSPLEVILLQHPRERRMTINTGRLVHLGIENARVFYGVHFDKVEALQNLLSDIEDPAEVGILFPSPGALDLADHPPQLKKMIVVDGTWNEAKKMLHRSPSLQKIPRYFLKTESTSNYRIRKAPRPEYLSTVEATVALLRTYEKNPTAHQNLIDVFQIMVRQQEGFGASEPRHLRNKRRMVKIKERARLKKLLFSTKPELRIAALREKTADEIERIEKIADALWGVKDIYKPESLRPLFDFKEPQ